MVVRVVSLASPVLVMRFQCVKRARSLDLVKGEICYNFAYSRMPVVYFYYGEKYYVTPALHRSVY